MGSRKKDGKPKQITITYTDELERMITDIRNELMKIDEVKYGKKFVERELNKARGSRYSNESIVRMMVRAGYDVLKKDLQVKYTEAKQVTGKHDANIILQMIMEYEQRRAGGGLNDIFKI